MARGELKPITVATKAATKALLEKHADEHAYLVAEHMSAAGYKPVTKTVHHWVAEDEGE